jgi:tetratricopeptide (TPR) repeat protein
LAKLIVNKTLIKADSQFKAGNFDEAKSLYELVLASFPGNQIAIKRLKIISGIRLSRGTPESENSTLDELAALYRGQNYVELVQAATVHLGQYPTEVGAWNLLGSASARLGRTNRALEAFENMLRLDPKNADAYYNKGTVLQSLGNFNEAEASYRYALSHRPNYFEALNALGTALADQGRFIEAIAEYKKSVSLNPQFSEAHYNLGNALRGIGEKETAVAAYQSAISIKGGFSEAHYNLGNTLQELGKHAEAICCYQEALNINPKSGRAYYNLGISYEATGRLSQAIGAFQSAIAIDATHARAYNNLGKAFSEQGNLDKALEALDRAIELSPDHWAAHHNRGNVLNARNKKQAALESYNTSLLLNPHHADTHYNRGLVLRDLRRAPEALEAMTAACTVKPDFVDALFEKGQIFQGDGDLAEALSAYHQALSIQPDHTAALYNFGNGLTDVVEFHEHSNGMQDRILSVLDRGTFVRPVDISNTTLSLLKKDPKIAEILRKHSAGTLAEDVCEHAKQLGQISLFLRLMKLVPLADLELESLLSELRRILVLKISNSEVLVDVTPFQSGLALQCFLNDFIYPESNLESKALQTIEDSVATSFEKGIQPNTQEILCLASYRSLSAYEWHDQIIGASTLAEVLGVQVTEPRQEEEIKSKLTSFGNIDDKVSSSVRNQYEANPYPKWVSTRLEVDPKDIAEVAELLELRISNGNINPILAPEILIAGCGTGQHALWVASRFKESKVLAIDLSSSSLAYAKRKTDELAVENIEYLKADILEINELGRQFDLIESSGVLHHMLNPQEGWRNITNCLKPGGLMHIGLYSASARQEIAELRDYIKRLELKPDIATMKSFRAEIIASKKPEHESVVRSPDFYSLSAFRDLLFHVQEHRFTFPEIADALTQLGLKFCGLEGAKILEDFKKVNPSQEAMYDLKKWHAYELSRPKAFVGMYQFWCQKV